MMMSDDSLYEQVKNALNVSRRLWHQEPTVNGAKWNESGNDDEQAIDDRNCRDHEKSDNQS
jgi:hypothetical protein